MGVEVNTGYAKSIPGILRIVEFVSITGSNTLTDATVPCLSFSKLEHDCEQTLLLSKILKHFRIHLT